MVTIEALPLAFKNSKSRVEILNGPFSTLEFDAELGGHYSRE
jgi:hypothetical protein